MAAVEGDKGAQEEPGCDRQRGGSGTGNAHSVGSAGNPCGTQVQAVDTLCLAEASKKILLKELHREGRLTREQYEVSMRMASPGFETQLVTAPTRKKGDLTVLDTRGLWKQYGTEYDSHKAAMKDACSIQHGGNMGTWAWNTEGDRKKKRCNFHTQCPVQLRAVQMPQGKWVLEVLDVSHSLEDKEYRRKNSALTVDQESMALTGIDHGLKPTGIRRKANKAAFKMGITEKNPEGNLVGTPHRMFVCNGTRCIRTYYVMVA